MAKAAGDDNTEYLFSSKLVDYIQTTLGLNITEMADILHATRRTIIDWQAGKYVAGARHQERIIKLTAICQNWENENLGQIRHLLGKNIWNNCSLFDLLCSNKLDFPLIDVYLTKIREYILALNEERENSIKIKEQYGFKQLSDKEKFDKLKKKER